MLVTSVTGVVTKLRGKYDTQAHRDAEHEELKKRDLLTPGDEGGGKGAGWGGRGRMEAGAFAGLGILHGVASAFGSGAQLGQAAGSLAHGLGQAVTGAASAFVHVGESVLGLVLSPFGASGAAVAKLAGGFGQGLVGVLAAGGGLAAAGLRIGTTFFAGFLAAKGVLVGGGIGAVAGAVIGTLLPGAGTIAGAVIGAGIGSAVVGTILQAVTGIIGSVSSALGQAMSAVGEAFGKLGSAIGEVLSGLKDTLSDLISTGNRFAQSALTISRGGNLPLAQAGQAASLAQIVTGSPSGLDGALTGFGNMSQYRGYKLRALGVPGATGTDPTGDFVKSADAYKGMDPIRRQILLSGGFGNIPGVGNLFALNAQSPGLAAQAAKTAKDTALTPQETVANAKLSLNLAEVQATLDRLKTRLLTDLMPSIQLALGAFTKFFGRNEGKIVAGLERIGEFLYNKFPGYLQTGMAALFQFGQAFATAFPHIFQIGMQILIGAIQAIQGLAGSIGGNALVKRFAPDVADALTGFSQMKLTGLVGGDSAAKLAQAQNYRKMAEGYDKDAQGFDSDPIGTAGKTNDPDSPLYHKSKADLLNLGRLASARADKLAAEAQASSPAQAAVNAASASAAQWFGATGAKVNGALGDAFGLPARGNQAGAQGGQGQGQNGQGGNGAAPPAPTERDYAGMDTRTRAELEVRDAQARYAADKARYGQGGAGAAPPPQAAAQKLQLDGEVKHLIQMEIDLETMRHTVTNHLAKQEVMALQRAGA